MTPPAGPPIISPSGIPIKDAIVEKFSADLRKLFEVAIGSNRRVVPAPNAELATIMGVGNKIRT